MAVLAILAMTLSGCFPILAVGAFASGPFMTQVPNSGCYILDKDLMQRRPCKPEETR